eukprot:111839_1
MGGKLGLAALTPEFDSDFNTTGRYWGNCRHCREKINDVLSYPIYRFQLPCKKQKMIADWYPVHTKCWREFEKTINDDHHTLTVYCDYCYQTFDGKKHNYTWYSNGSKHIVRYMFCGTPWTETMVYGKHKYCNQRR